jgi:exopolyphosphatase / guanosine-5'-triphosphate,3'-diphosphate pyrophosphatase
VKLGAIDIGSNAARLLIIEVYRDKDKTEFNKLNLVRVPLRLGFDVFEYGSISARKQDMIVNTMKAYQLLLQIYGVTHFRACATSAMRDAQNAEDIIKRVKWETGLEIEVISGQQEAAFIYENHIEENMNKDGSFLYIDVGGGSTELTFFAGSKMVFKESFNIGTIRLIKNQVEEKHWEALKDFVKTSFKKYDKITAIGSGGNINKMFSLSKQKEGKPLTYEMLRDYYKEFSGFSVNERMVRYHLREDRADVIVPALQIYTNLMRWANIQEIYVPKIGLADGIIHHLWAEMKLKEMDV